MHLIPFTATRYSDTDVCQRARRQVTAAQCRQLQYQIVIVRLRLDRHTNLNALAAAAPGRSTLWEYENLRADPGQCGIVGKLSANVGYPESASCLIAPLPAINDGKCKSWNETEGPRTEWENWSCGGFCVFYENTECNKFAAGHTHHVSRAQDPAG